MTVAQLESQVWTLLDDDGTYYPEASVLAALNEAQRFFVLISLCLEKTAALPLTAAEPFYKVLATFSDWLLPRRIQNSAGMRLRAGRLSEFAAMNRTWQQTAAMPQRYALSGLDFLSIYPQPPDADTLTVTYVHAPADLVNQNDEPEIRENSQFALANYAAYALRQPEGGQEFRKFTGYLGDFLDEAHRVAALVRAKNLDADYERLPFELALADRSRLLSLH